MVQAARLVAVLIFLLALLLPGCAPPGVASPTGAAARPTATAGGEGQSRRVTLVYTGYGRGGVDPQAGECT
jgi:hypothetical protein